MVFLSASLVLFLLWYVQFQQRLESLLKMPVQADRLHGYLSESLGRQSTDMHKVVLCGNDRYVSLIGSPA
jgi:hypothetical protein